MSEESISSTHIQKLGHKILEIRERALFNLLSKLERGIIFDNDFARCKEIVMKLFDWFTFNEFTYEDIVLTLIKRVISNENGLLLINLFGKEYFQIELSKIKSLIKEEYYEDIEDILAIINKDDKSNSGVPHIQIEVPPLNSDFPLSYRTSGSDNSVESTASPLEGFVKYSGSINYKLACDLNEQSVSTERVKSNKNILYFLPWHSLLASDTHVLQSLEDTLRNPSEPVDIINSCEFFRDVLLNDFPAEIFLQRPSIIKLFFDTLWTSPSSRITTSVLICLVKFTKAIKTRIYFFADPNVYNFKNSNFIKEVDNHSPYYNAFINGVNCKRENSSETALLMKTALSIPEYSLSVIIAICDYLFVPDNSPRFKRKKCQVGINSALFLFNEVTDLFLLTVKKDFWKERLDPSAVSINKKLNEVFLKISELLEHYRLQVLSTDWRLDFRLIHLHLIIITNYFISRLISFDQFDTVLPRVLKDSFSNSILDPTLRRFYPAVHESLIIVAKTFKGSFDENSFKKYEQVDLICKSLSSSIILFRDWKSLPVITFIALAKESLISLEFHECSDFIKRFIDISYNKITLDTFENSILSNVDDVIVALLAHKCDDIKLETYKQCQKKVISTIGAKLNVSKSSTPGSKIVFLLRSKILLEIALYGIMDKNIEVQNLAEDILIHVLKCKILVTDDIWMLAMEAIIPNFPILICHINHSSLGKCILSILDPDRSVAFNIPQIEVYRSNCGLLFSESKEIREEAVSRLCWLLSSEPDSHTLLPHTTNLHDKALSLIFQIRKPEEYGQSRFNQHFFQPSALHQVIDLLNSENVEPAIRRSAITQISVMLQDPILHQTFIEENGLNVLKTIMKSALTERSYNDYPDSIIACLNILKNICLYNVSVRNELSNDLLIYQFCLRGLFMFCTEDNVKKDGSTLMFLLVYSNFYSGSLLKSDFGLPALVLNKLRSPFICNTQSTESANSLPSYLYLLSDKWALNSLRIHWNVGWLNDLQKLFEVTDLTDADYIPIRFNDRLKLSNMDLLACKSSSLEYNLKYFLNVIQNATNHKEVLEGINILQCCLNLFIILNKNDACFLDITTFSWSQSFSKYLNTPPGGAEDNILLSHVLKFLDNLLAIFKLRENSSWITSFLTNKNHYIHNFIDFENSKNEEVKELMYSILNLVSSCVSHEQRYLDFHRIPVDEENDVTRSWGHLVVTIVDNLQFNDVQHFYNLAYMEKSLSAIVHLTSNFGWSNSIPNELPKKLLNQMTSGLLELIVAFYFGKGECANDSLMGSNISRNILIILNHIVMEVQNSKTKNWEELFITNDVDGQNCLKIILDLITSNDVVLRAAALHLLSGLCISTRLAISLVQDVELNSKNIWEIALQILIDRGEASSVKEGAANLLTNLTTHTKTLSEDIVLISSVLPTKTQNDVALNVILKILNEINFFNLLGEVIKNVYLEKEIELQFFLTDGSNSVDERITIDSMSSRNTPNIRNNGYIITPGAIKGISLFLFNFLALDSKNICKYLLNNNLVKILLRCIHLPIIEITTTKDFSLYCDIIEMNTAICMVLNRAAIERVEIISMIYNTRDCFNILLYLLNPDIYSISLSQLLFLRNKLWSSIFNLLETLLLSGETDIEKVQSTEAFKIITTLIHENCAESFLKSICESIADKNFNDLQISALSSLTSLLTLGTYVENSTNEESITSSKSVQSLLDFTRTPRMSSIEFREGINKKDDYSTIKTLENIYFNNKDSRTINKINEYSEQMAGGELCRILLHLFELINLKDSKCSLKKRYSIINTLTSLLSLSNEAKKVAYNYELVEIIIAQLKEIYIKLSLEPMDVLRRSSDKKRVCPLLKELELYICLINNFMVSDTEIKVRFAQRELADVSHKLWVWFTLQKPLVNLCLKMLCSFTNNCKDACETLPLTSGIVGSGPRKLPNNSSLLSVVCGQVSKEMDQISKTHCLNTLQLCFHLLTNCLSIVDCRVTILKNNLLQNFLRLHPAITKRQKLWENVEIFWLDFLNEFTSYPEGQASVIKSIEVFDVLVSLASNSKPESKTVPLEVLRNVSFYQASRARLLSSSDFILLLSNKLTSGTIREKNIIVSIIWALAANNHKAKLVFKCAHIPNKLYDLIKGLQLYDSGIDNEDLQRMAYVYEILRGEKT